MWVFLTVAVSVGVPVIGGLQFVRWVIMVKGRQREANPFNLLAARYAAGEITETEYGHAVDVLTGGPAPHRLAPGD
jgi:uncharacterized membrane protein